MASPTGPSSFEISNQMASAANVHSGAAVGGGNHAGGGGMLPIGEKSLDEVAVGGPIPTHGEGMDSMFAGVGGGFQESIVNKLGAVAGYLGTPEAHGEQGLDLSKMGSGERPQAPTVQGDLQMKKVGMVGNEGAGHGG